MRELGLLMYDKDSRSGPESAAWAKEKFEALGKRYPSEKEFWEYMEGQWLHKVHMWVVGYRNLPAAGQDTNAAIEGYHGFMKSILKSERTRMVGRRVDWCIHALTEDVVDHYWVKSLHKEWGFVDNKKKQGIAVSSLMRARLIPDSDVTLPSSPGEHALVTSTQHRHIRYIVHNPGEEFAGCSCVWAQKGNLCKHILKVLQLLRPDLAEGTIARYCGRQAGTTSGGMGRLLSPQSVQPTPPQTEAVPTPGRTPARKSAVARDIGERLRQLVAELSIEVIGSHVLKEHLLAELNQLIGRTRALKAEISAGTVHPFLDMPVLVTVDDGRGFTLVRSQDFLERGQKKKPARRLRLGD